MKSFGVFSDKLILNVSLLSLIVAMGTEGIHAAYANSPKQLAVHGVKSTAVKPVDSKSKTKASTSASSAKKTAPVVNLANENFQAVTPVDLLKDPKQFLNKKVMFEGIFSSFSNLGLDYKKAFRDSKDYISFLIKRPDVTNHIIPLSELKLIFPRKKSEEVLKLETGDRISIKAQVFSTALSEPWLDILEVKIIEKVKKAKPADCISKEC
jgi:hypothetical protein